MASTRRLLVEFYNYIDKEVGNGKTCGDVKIKYEQVDQENIGREYLYQNKKGRGDNSNLKMASTWTEEETTKFGRAFADAYECQSFAFGTTEFWEYISIEVGHGKTVADVEEKYFKGLDDIIVGRVPWLEEFLASKDKKSEDKK